MKRLLAASAGAAALAIALAAPAFADCASEIKALKATQFTGSVKPTDMTSGGAGAAQQGGVSAQNETAMQSGGETPKAQSDKMTAPQTATSGQATGAGLNVAAQKAGQTPETQATTAMNATVGQSAASPQDVQQQMAGKPTSAQQAQANASVTATGGGTMPAAGGAEAEFGVLIQQAENYQKLGNEDACMNVIKQAKSATK
jgi:hypothetical protein